LHPGREFLSLRNPEIRMEVEHGRFQMQQLRVRKRRPVQAPEMPAVWRKEIFRKNGKEGLIPSRVPLEKSKGPAMPPGLSLDFGPLLDN